MFGDWDDQENALPERLEVAYEIIKSLELQDWRIP
jgi:hypothetical protein